MLFVAIAHGRICNPDIASLAVLIIWASGHGIASFERLDLGLIIDMFDILRLQG